MVTMFDKKGRPTLHVGRHLKSKDMPSIVNCNYKVFMSVCLAV